MYYLLPKLHLKYRKFRRIPSIHNGIAYCSLLFYIAIYAIVVFYFIYDGIEGIEGIMNKGSVFLVFFVGLK